MKVGSLVGDFDGEAVGGKQPARLKVTLSIKKLRSTTADVELSANCTSIVGVAAGVLKE